MSPIQQGNLASDHQSDSNIATKTASASKEVFSVKTDVFEGPLELLIELVEKRKLLINDISLAEVTDEYMQTVSAMQEMSLPNTAQFVILAATLLLVKSKSLLPVLDLTKEQEFNIEDLEGRLKRYQIYRNAGVLLSERFGKVNMYAPEFSPPRQPVFLPDSHCALPELQAAIRDVLHSLPKFNKRPTAQLKKTISLEDMIGQLQKRIENQLQTKFSDLRSGETEHRNVIVVFLAILELFKQGDVLVKQEGNYSDIELEKQGTDTPRYY